MFMYSLILFALALGTTAAFSSLPMARVEKGREVSPVTRYVKFVTDGTAPREIVELQKINEHEVSVPLTLSDITANYGNRAALTHPVYLTGEIQLEELEADTSTLTAMALLPDGRVEFRTTDGPLPLKIQGEWASDGDAFFMVLTRTFEVGANLEGVTYQLTRVFEGSVDVHPAYKFAEGTVRVGDYTTGYFKFIVLPEDVSTPRAALSTLNT
jgi:hypothetical protein